ncbi:MAG: UDP-N-acetylmuramoyl-L-alanyl-D-glutamate--2,6-diaminopimelate ligase [Brevinemataceae bacterium]
MKKMLKELFPTVSVVSNIQISSITNDSRNADKESLFIAYSGFQSNPHDYIADAYHNECRCFLIANDRITEFKQRFSDAEFIGSDDLQHDRSEVALKFYDYPDRKLTMIGITGTNGKTTTAMLICQALKKLGFTIAFFGTVHWEVAGQIYPAANTTPDLLDLLNFLSSAVDQGVTHVVMEVSSHALNLGRLEGISFDVAGFTNLTQDHLDFHQDMEDYFGAKCCLFTDLLKNSPKQKKQAFINIDDEFGKRLLSILKEEYMPCVSLSIEGTGDYNAQNISLSAQGLKFALSCRGGVISMDSALVGRVNIYNLSMAAAVLEFLEISLEKIAEALSDIVVLGRMQRVSAKNNITFFIDYAHTPDALEKALVLINQLIGSENKSIVIFGAGGDRDASKRPLMAQAAESADIIIITSDNPRTESPQDIIDQIVQGIPAGKEYYCEIDRAKAIQLAYRMSLPGDIILIAGKGHEEYQIIGKEKIYFSDVEQVQQFCG